MPKPIPPVPLSDFNKVMYYDLYEAFGKEEADKYAADMHRERPVEEPMLLPPVRDTPKLSVTLPPELFNTPVAPVVVGPLGTQAPVTPIAPTYTQLINRPGIDEVKSANADAKTKRINELTTAYKLSGLSLQDAEIKARKEVEGVFEPRSVEFKSKPVSPGSSSELAVRGEELVSRLPTARVVAEAVKPQVLESEQQAEARARFKLDSLKAQAQIEKLARDSKQTPLEVAQKMRLDNTLNAERIAKVAFGADVTMSQIKEVEDQLNAPIYAASAELTKSVFEPLQNIPSRAMRALLEKEVSGRRVESPGATAIRNIGGVSRIGLGAIKAGVMDPISKYVIAAQEGIPVEKVQERIDRARDDAGDRKQVVPGVDYAAMPGSESRQKLDTGNWLKDTAYEIATGRSAVDDYIDLGINPRLATVVGVATEFAIPQSPLGWVTDVPSAFASVGQVGKYLNKASGVAGNVAKSPALYAFFSDTARSAGDVGLVLEKPTFWQTLTKAADTRTKVATDLATQLSDVAALDKLATDAARVESPAVKTAANDKLVAVLDADHSKHPLINEIVVKVKAAGTREPALVVKELQKILRGDDGYITKINKVASPDEKVNVQADIVRNTYAAAIKNRVELGEVNEAAVRAAVAETLEKVPDNGWAFMTPTLLVKKSVMAEKDFQKKVAAAVRGLKADATMAEVQKAVESKVKEILKETGSVAEPFAMTPARVESFFPSFPRGGLERLETPSSRRFPLLEVVQDLYAAKKAIDPLETFRIDPALRPRVSDTFANSQFIQSLDNTLESALKGRVSTTTRTMLQNTRSEISALGVSATSVNPLRGGAQSGTLIDAIRVQGSLNGYLTARIASDVSGKNTMKASKFGEAVDLPLLSTLPKAPTSKKIQDIVRNFFGEGKSGLGYITSKELEPRIVVLADESLSVDTALEAVTWTINRLRKEFPALKNVGRRAPGTLEDDISGAALDYIIKSESKKIYTDNFFEAYPELIMTDKAAADMRNNFINEMNKYGASISPAEKAEALKLWDEKFDSTNIEEFGKLVDDQIKTEFANRATEYSTTTAHLTQTTKGKEFFDELIKFPNGSVTSAFTSATDIESYIAPMLDFATMSKLIRPLDEASVVEFLTDILKVPVGSTEYAVIKSLLPIDELTTSAGAISDNLLALRRNPEALGAVSSAFKGIANQIRSLSLPGLTAGIAIPNAKFFAMNYFGAAPMMAITSPSTVLAAVGAELRAPRSVHLNNVLSAAKNPSIANNVAFTSTTGVPYTNAQVANFLDNNYFGMTERDFAFANKFGEDVRIAVGAAPNGMQLGPGASKLKDSVLRYLNVNGTNIYSRVANQVDVNFRKQTFIEALRNGEPPSIAQRTASNAIFDYGRIPPGVRQSLSRYMSFVSFWAMSNAEIVGALLRPKAMSNIAKSINIQRDLNRGWGEWEYASDADKLRLYSYYLGQDEDKQPAYFVGPAHPILGPLVDSAQLLPALYSIGANVAEGNFADAWNKTLTGGSKVIMEKIFTPVIGYLQDIGLIGNSPKSMIVPWQQVNFHQALGKEHFGEWIRESGISSIDVEDMRLGVPEFNRTQYTFKDESAKNRAAGVDLLFALAGIGRSWDDATKIYGVLSPVEGANMKRFSQNKALFILQYALGGNLKKGTPEYEFYYQALKSEGFELAPR